MRHDRILVQELILIIYATDKVMLIKVRKAIIFSRNLGIVFCLKQNSLINFLKVLIDYKYYNEENI